MLQGSNRDADKTGENKEFARRAQSAADKKENKK